jgi:acyl-CoA thioester hydrolase
MTIVRHDRRGRTLAGKEHPSCSGTKLSAISRWKAIATGCNADHRTPLMNRHPPGRRDHYRYFHAITTRWMDNDVFRHVNNVNYFSFFDTAVTYFEMSNGVVDLLDGPVHCVVAEVMCRYHSSVAFPDRIAVGIRVARIGGSSVRYEIGVFRNDDDEAAAEGHFVHVFVDRTTQRPTRVPEASRALLEKIAI